MLQIEMIELNLLRALAGAGADIQEEQARLL